MVSKQNMRFIFQLFIIYSVRYKFPSQAHNYLFLQTGSFPVQQPSAALFIGANCLTSCAKTYIHIQNKKRPAKKF